MKLPNRSVAATMGVGLLLSSLAISPMAAQAPSDASKSLPRYPLKSTALMAIRANTCIESTRLNSKPHAK
jgi:hypothetical protein